MLGITSDWVSVLDRYGSKVKVDFLYEEVNIVHQYMVMQVQLDQHQFRPWYDCDDLYLQFAL